jgi:hypothetical protein
MDCIPSFNALPAQQVVVGIENIFLQGVLETIDCMYGWMV